MTCDRGIDAGAYVLHALEDDELRTYREHLSTCEACRHEVEDLQGVVDTLPMTTTQYDAPAALKSRIMRTVEAEAQLLRAAGADADRPVAAPRRARRFGFGALTLRPAMAAACASVLVAVGVVSGAVLLNGSDPQTRSITGSGPVGTIAQVRLTDGHASLHTVGLPSAPSGKVYQVWLKKGDEAPVPTHTLFNVRDDGRSTVSIEEPVNGYDTVLVTAEQSGGSVTPTSAPIITAQLS